jgi:hypothetical protein
MKCPECVREGERSRVGSHGATRTAMGVERFWDEDGVAHVHDPNKTTESFSCSRGHRWQVSAKPPCPADGCDYNGDLP